MREFLQGMRKKYFPPVNFFLIAVAILAEMTAVRHGVGEPSWAAKPERRFDPSACEVKEVKPA